MREGSIHENVVQNWQQKSSGLAGASLGGRHATQEHLALAAEPDASALKVGALDDPQAGERDVTARIAALGWREAVVVGARAQPRAAAVPRGLQSP